MLLTWDVTSATDAKNYYCVLLLAGRQILPAGLLFRGAGIARHGSAASWANGWG